jgi:DNA mismatch repair protein MutH
MLAPLVGVYGLRLGDAHLPSSKIEQAFELVGLEIGAIPIKQGIKLLEVTVSSLERIRDIILRNVSGG